MFLATESRVTSLTFSLDASLTGMFFVSMIVEFDC